MTIVDAKDLTPAQHTSLWTLLADSYEHGARQRWAYPETHVVAWSETGLARAHAGVVGRSGYCDELAASIGGVCGVRTAEHYRSLGLATTAVGQAVVLLRERGVDFVLLCCDGELCGFYERLGFAPWDGAFRCSRPLPQTVMVLPLKKTPRKSIDLCGLPW